jgi:hypothetical protein
LHALKKLNDQKIFKFQNLKRDVISVWSPFKFPSWLFV